MSHTKLLVTWMIGTGIGYAGILLLVTERQLEGREAVGVALAVLATVITYYCQRRILDLIPTVKPADKCRVDRTRWEEGACDEGCCDDTDDSNDGNNG